MKYTKKLLSLVLVLVLALAMAVPGMAAGSYTITINDAAANHTYAAYQIFDGDYSGNKLVNIEWGTGVNNSGLLVALQTDETLENAFADCSTAKDVAGVLDGQTFDSELAQAFAAVVGDYLDTVAGTSTQGDGKYVISGLDDGYYFVKQTNEEIENEAYTRYIIKVVGANVDVTPKSNSVPTGEKTTTIPGTETIVSATSYNIGDDVPFTLTATLPAATTFDAYDSYDLTFHDTMSKGLAYKNDAKVYLNTVAVGNEITSYFDVTTGTAEGEKTTLTVADKNDNVKDIPNIKGGDKIIVTYTAELTTDAIVGGTGNLNELYLEYSNDPNAPGTGHTPDKEVYIYTFKMDGLKYDGGSNANKKPLENAWFTLQNSDGEYALVDDSGNVTGWIAEKDIVGNEIKHETVTGSGVYEDGNIKSDAEGKFVVNGLAEGTYTLTETVAPAGYNLLAAPITIKVEATYGATGNLTGMTVTMGTDNTSVTSIPATGIFTPEIANMSGTTLPSTGGMGTTIFYTLGGVLVVGAAILLVTKKRVHDVEG